MKCLKAFILRSTSATGKFAQGRVNNFDWTVKNWLKNCLFNALHWLGCFRKLCLTYFSFFQMIEDPPFPCLNGDGLQDGGCWGPPPIFDIPPPPRPPWGDLNCDENDLRSRPLTSDQGGSLGQGSRSHLTGEDFIQDSCDIHPLVIDSHFYLGESLFTILVIVICSCILVGIILVVACVIYR